MKKVNRNRALPQAFLKLWKTSNWKFCFSVTIEWEFLFQKQQKWWYEELRSGKVKVKVIMNIWNSPGQDSDTRLSAIYLSVLASHCDSVYSPQSSSSWTDCCLLYSSVEISWNFLHTALVEITLFLFRLYSVSTGQLLYCCDIFLDIKLVA